MSQRTFPANTSCNIATSKSADYTPLEASRSGHVIQVHGDQAIYDTTSGDFIDPAKVKNKNGRIGLIP